MHIDRPIPRARHAARAQTQTEGTGRGAELAAAAHRRPGKDGVADRVKEGHPRPAARPGPIQRMGRAARSKAHALAGQLRSAGSAAATRPEAKGDVSAGQSAAFRAHLVEVSSSTAKECSLGACQAVARLPADEPERASSPNGRGARGRWGRARTCSKRLARAPRLASGARARRPVHRPPNGTLVREPVGALAGGAGYPERWRRGSHGAHGTGCARGSSGGEAGTHRHDGERDRHVEVYPAYSVPPNLEDQSGVKSAIARGVENSSISGVAPAGNGILNSKYEGCIHSGAHFARPFRNQRTRTAEFRRGCKGRTGGREVIEATDSDVGGSCSGSPWLI